MSKTTDEELQRLAADGLDPEAEIWTTHFFSHFDSSESERASFRDALRESGFGTVGRFAEIGTGEEVDGDSYWHHWAFTVFASAPEVLRRADETARQIADTHGVRYDGWQVQRGNRGSDTDPPRLADDQD